MLSFITSQMMVLWKAVNNVSLDLDVGDTLGLVGETGAGKTTTALGILRLIADPPGKIVSGDILFEGESLLEKSEAEMRKIRGKEISMIFQDPMTALNPVLTVGDQIAEVIHLHENCTKQQAGEKAKEMLEMVGIPAARGSEYPHQFSGGMKQRVVIAMALACNPKLLLADEPTTALDVTIQAPGFGHDERAETKNENFHAVDHPRSGRGSRDLRQGGHHVCRRDRGIRNIAPYF